MTIKNKKTGSEYPVTKEEWDAMKPERRALFTVTMDRPITPIRTAPKAQPKVPDVVTRHKQQGPAEDLKDGK